MGAHTMFMNLGFMLLDKRKNLIVVLAMSIYYSQQERMVQHVYPLSLKWSGTSLVATEGCVLSSREGRKLCLRVSAIHLSE
jgi:hypothetical protein